MFHFMFVHYTFSSVWVAEWPPFGKWLPARLAIFSHCILFICNILFISRFGFKSWICLLIASVPVHCFSITFKGVVDIPEIFTRLTICSSCDLSISNFSYFPFCFPRLDFDSDCTHCRSLLILKHENLAVFQCP